MRLDHSFTDLENINRVYLPYQLWEEYNFGMWRNVYGKERDTYLEKAIVFTGNANLYGKWMIKAVKQWPNSCLHNLTCAEMNRQAWIGHAACCLAINCPEDITRLAWHELTKEQQDKANEKADRAIEYFEILYKRGIKLCLNMV
jgi:hypothetical protein